MYEYKYLGIKMLFIPCIIHYKFHFYNHKSLLSPKKGQNLSILAAKYKFEEWTFY